MWEAELTQRLNDAGVKARRITDILGVLAGIDRHEPIRP